MKWMVNFLKSSSVWFWEWIVDLLCNVKEASCLIPLCNAFSHTNNVAYRTPPTWTLRGKWTTPKTKEGKKGCSKTPTHGKCYPKELGSKHFKTSRRSLSQHLTKYQDTFKLKNCRYSNPGPQEEISSILNTLNE